VRGVEAEVFAFGAEHMFANSEQDIVADGRFQTENLLLQFWGLGRIVQWNQETVGHRKRGILDLWRCILPLGDNIVYIF